MKKNIQAIITGLGAYLPSNVLSNSDLEKMVETSDEWITTRTGIKERRIASATETTSYMATQAAIDACKKADISPDSLDAIIVATMTPDHFCPSSSALVQHQLQAKNACAIDIQAACTGFLYALSIAKGWIESGLYKRILVIASEKNSAFINYKDRNTCVLFGDGSGAAIIEADNPSTPKKGLTIEHICLGSDGEQAQLLTIPAGGSAEPSTNETIASGRHFIQMNGKELFKHAVRRMEQAIVDCLQETQLAESDISWIIPHQANIRIMEALAKRFQTPWDRIVKTIHKYGNTSASTIPIALDELISSQHLQHNEKIVLTAFGGGLTWGAALLKNQLQ